MNHATCSHRNLKMGACDIHGLRASPGLRKLLLQLLLLSACVAVDSAPGPAPSPSPFAGPSPDIGGANPAPHPAPAPDHSGATTTAATTTSGGSGGGAAETDTTDYYSPFTFLSTTREVNQVTTVTRTTTTTKVPPNCETRVLSCTGLTSSDWTAEACTAWQDGHDHVSEREEVQLAFLDAFNTASSTNYSESELFHTDGMGLFRCDSVTAVLPVQFSLLDDFLAVFALGNAVSVVLNSTTLSFRAIDLTTLASTPEPSTTTRTTAEPPPPVVSHPQAPNITHMHTHQTQAPQQTIATYAAPAYTAPPPFGGSGPGQDAPGDGSGGRDDGNGDLADGALSPEQAAAQQNALIGGVVAAVVVVAIVIAVVLVVVLRKNTSKVIVADKNKRDSDFDSAGFNEDVESNDPKQGGQAVRASQEMKMTDM